MTIITAGDYSFKIGDPNNSSISYGVDDAAEQQIEFDQSKSIVEGGAYYMNLNIAEDTKIGYSLDLSQPTTPSVTVTELIDYGPYGKVHLVGDVSSEGWSHTSNNVFVYNPETRQLTYTLVTDSTGTDPWNWQWKITTSDWQFQLTGTAPEWNVPANILSLGTPYTMGMNNGGEVMMLNLDQVGPATYEFIIDVPNDLNAAPVLTVKSFQTGAERMYVKGGSGISPIAQWGESPMNMMQYNAKTNTLFLTVDTLSESIDSGDWQWKIANANWSIQWTGTDGNWMSEENKVVPGTPYSLGDNLQTLFLDPASAGPGSYYFEVDLTEMTLTVTK